jgi:hypothetical protein
LGVGEEVAWAGAAGDALTLKACATRIRVRITREVMRCMAIL